MSQTIDVKKLSRKDLLERKKQLGAEITKQGEAYEARKEAGEEQWPDETHEAWESINKEYNDTDQELIRKTNDEAVQARMDQIRVDEEQSIRTGHRPGLDDNVPGLQNRTYGELGLDREEAGELARNEADRRTAFRFWINGGKNGTPEIAEACQRVGFNISQEEIRLPLLGTEQLRAAQVRVARLSQEDRRAAFVNGEHRALSTVTAGAGPELIPITFVNMLEMAMLANGDMLTYVDTITTQTGEEIRWPIIDDTANEGVFVGTEGEDTQAVGEPDPAFARLSWGAHEVHSKWVKVPIALGEDSMFNMDSLLAMALGQRLGRIMNKSATTGNGSGQFTGLLHSANAAPVGKTAAATNAITYDEIVELEHSVDPAYRPESQYCMHDAILLRLRLLKDGDGRPLWQQSMRDGTPDRLHGKPYAYNQAMPDTLAASAKVLLFGRLSDYKLRRVGDIRLVRAAERFIERLQIGFLGYTRADGKLMRPTSDDQTSVKVLQMSS